MSGIFDRSEKLLGKDVMETLHDTTVMVCGAGGVGSYAIEALGRLGIGHLIIVDKDCVELTNINRQLFALHSTLNQTKVEIAKKRLLDINPQIQVEILQEHITPANIDLLDKYSPQYLVDAIDTIESKIALIKWCQKRNIEEIVCTGMGKRIDPSKVQISKLNQTSGDPLCRKLRELSKKEGLIMSQISVIYSVEQRILPEIDDVNKATGSIILVPAYAGLLAAQYILKRIMR